MKKTALLLISCTLMIGACATQEPGELEAPEAATSGPVLLVTDGSLEVTYDQQQLEALPASQATFRDVTYTGVPLHVLLEDAGFSPAELRAVKAIALDGFSANFEPDQFLAADTLVAYARVEGELADDEKPFRMVVPEGGGGLNVRLLRSIEVIP